MIRWLSCYHINVYIYATNSYVSTAEHECTCTAIERNVSTMIQVEKENGKISKSYQTTRVARTKHRCWTVMSKPQTYAIRFSWSDGWRELSAKFSLWVRTRILHEQRRRDYPVQYCDGNTWFRDCFPGWSERETSSVLIESTRTTPAVLRTRNNCFLLPFDDRRRLRPK